MSTPEMTGRREERDGRALLVIERTFHAPVADVWAACTEPGRMERWIGTWSGDPASGSVTFRMTAEGDDVRGEEMDVLVCEPPHRFAVRGRTAEPFSEDGAGEKVVWEMGLELVETDGSTTLRFTQVLVPGPSGVDMAASVGPGWEYYLDRLAASLAGHDLAAVAWEPYAEGAAHYRSTFG